MALLKRPQPTYSVCVTHSLFDNVDSSPCHITVTEERVWGKRVWYHERRKKVAWCLMVLLALCFQEPVRPTFPTVFVMGDINLN